MKNSVVDIYLNTVYTLIIKLFNCYNIVQLTTVEYARFSSSTTNLDVVNRKFNGKKELTFWLVLNGQIIEPQAYVQVFFSNVQGRSSE